MNDASAGLLAPRDPHPVDLRRLNGRSEIFLTCDHAGRRLPESLGTLGLNAAEMDRHIAWDIGAAGLAERLSERLDAALVMQLYSRLVIDCNRPLTSPTSIAVVSEATEIVGNRALSPQQVHARVREVFDPYHDRIDAELELRRRAGRPTVLVAVHSFTPIFHGEERPWHVGLLYNRDPGFADRLGDTFQDVAFTVGHNEPYSVSDVTDYTIPVHGERRGIPHVMVEVRQDLIEGEAGQEEWADRLSGLLARALKRFNGARARRGARRPAGRRDDPRNRVDGR